MVAGETGESRNVPVDTGVGVLSGRETHWESGRIGDAG